MTQRSRQGYTLIEVVFSIVILTMGVLALIASSQVAAASLRRATLELRVAQLIEEDVDRLRLLPFDSLRDGSAARVAGDTYWTVTDSGAFLRIEVEVVARPEGGATLADTVFVYRPR